MCIQGQAFTITTPGAPLFFVARLFHCIVVKCLASIQAKTWRRKKLIPRTGNMLLIWVFVSTIYVVTLHFREHFTCYVGMCVCGL